MPKVKVPWRKIIVNDASQYLKEKFFTFNSPIERFVAKLEAKPGFYQCSVCYKSINIKNFEQHSNGKKHQKKLDGLKNSVIMNSVKIRQNDFVLGLEYLVELANTPKEELIYICFLCREYAKEKNILDHFKSCGHTQKYLEKHFPETANKIQTYLGQHKDVRDEFLKLTCIVIGQDCQQYRDMLPTVCFYNDFNTNPLNVYSLIESKQHLKETAGIVLKIIDELIDVVKSLEQPPEKEILPPKIEMPDDDNDDVIFIQPEIPKIDLSEDDDPMQRYIEATANFFKDLDNEKLERLKSSVMKVSNVTTSTLAELEPSPAPPTSENYVEPLNNAEIEFLMSNFDTLNANQQNDLLKVLFHMQNEEPERFKLIKSPFTGSL